MRHRIFVILVMSLLILFLPLFIKNSHSDQAPTASFTYSPAIPGPGDTITFDASASLAPNGWITSYTWDFGDGTVTPTSDPTVAHSYPIDGNYTVQLTVTDNNGLTDVAVVVIQVLKEVDFRVCYAGTVIPLPNAPVTVYYKNGASWVPAPARSSNPGVAVIYDNKTQPNVATQYRNPGFTASILLYNATNMGFDLHSSGNNMIVFFKFQWGSQTAYWPNSTTTYYTYDNIHGNIVANTFSPDGQPYWDSAASTYVIKAAHIESSECSPIVVGIFCPPSPQQYSLTVNIDPSGITAIPGQGLYANGTNVVLTAPTYVNVSASLRYRLNNWDVDGISRGSGVNPITVLMTANHTATAHYLQQYYLTVTSAYDSPTPLSGWFDTGTSIVASVSTPVSGPPGTRYACSGWTGTGSVPASGASPSVTFTISQPSTITWNWKTQYQLTVTSPYDSPTPITGWFDCGTTITASVTSPASGPSGTRYVCSGWTGTGSVPASGASPSVTFTINQTSTITWNWKTQYQVIFDQAGVGSDFSGTVVTIDSVNYSRNGLPTTPQFWWDQGSNHNFSFSSPLPVNGGTNYVWNSTNGLSSLQSETLTIMTSGNVIGNYITQNRITFDQTGGGSDFTDTVVIIDGVNYSKSQLPVSFPWTSSSVHTFAFQSPLVPSANTKYVWVSTTGLSNLQSGSITVTAYGNIVGNYKTQYYLAVSSVYGSTGGQGWYDSGSTAYATVTPLTVAGGSGIQYVFTTWGGDASGSTSPSNPITMDGPKTANANWKTQYYLTMVTNPPGVDSPSGAGWYDSGASVTISTDAFVDIVPGSSRYRFNGWTTADISEIADPTRSPTTVLVDKTKTATAAYAIMYNVTFNQSGVGSDFAGPVATIDSTGYPVGNLPKSFWWDDGSIHTFTSQSPLVVTANTKQYVWTSTAGLSPSQSDSSFTVSTFGSITGNYKTQYYLTVNSLWGSPTPTSSWFDDGTPITASVTSPSSGSTGTRYVCTGWTGSGNVPSSGTGTTATFTITQYSVITWKWNTQYLLTVATNPTMLSPQPTRNPTGQADPVNGWWYDESTKVDLTAQTVSGYVFSYWDADGTSQGNGVNPISINMLASHTTTTYYATPPPAFSVSINPMLASIYLGNSVAFTSTVNGGTSPYSYQWYLNNNPVSGATSNSWTYTPPTTGTFFVYLKVTDAGSNTVQSGTAKITVVTVPIGGYTDNSLSLANRTPPASIVTYIALVAFFAMGISLRKHKRK